MFHLIKKILIWLFSASASILVLVILGGLIFVNMSPQFGAKPAGENLERISQSSHFIDGKFYNLILTKHGCSAFFVELYNHLDYPSIVQLKA